METQIDAGDAAYSLYENSIVQAYTRQAYHISGGQVNPGTSSTQLTVAVEAGEAHISDTPVSWATEEVILDDAGVGPNGQDQNQPRVDVIFVAADGTLGAVTGEPHSFAPDTDADGNPITPAPFEHWSPAPDDGQRVGGLVLGLVLVRPGWSSAQDMSATEIKQWRLGGAEASQFVRGDGTDNGSVTITTKGAPFTLTDPTAQVAGGDYFRYDPNNATYIGARDAPVTLRGDLDVNRRGVHGLSAMFFDSSNAAVSIFDAAGGSPEQVFSIGNEINLYRKMTLRATRSETPPEWSYRQGTVTLRLKSRRPIRRLSPNTNTAV